MQSVLKIWFLATAVLLAGAVIWAFAPVLVVVLLVTAGLGLLVWVIVAFARWVEHKRGPPSSS
jgi:hypothetical protein